LSRARRIPIFAKLLAASLIPTLATFSGFVLYALNRAERSLEVELGRRLEATAAMAASQLDAESLSLLQPGDEATRTYRNLRHRLEALMSASGVARIYVFDREQASRCDTRAGVAIGDRVFSLELARAEVHAALGGKPSSSLLFVGHDGRRYKSGFAAVPAGEDAPPGTQPTFAVGVDAAATFYDELRHLRRELVSIGIVGTLAIIALAFFVSRFLIAPILALRAAAERIGGGDLSAPVTSGARDELGRLTAIVNDFLEYARRQRPALEARDLGALVTEVTEVVSPVAKARQVELTAEASSVRAPVDPGQLRRALLNLATNAVQAAPDDGRGRVTIATRREGARALLVVSDNGPGIPEEARERIFSPFYTTKQKGTGLGLAFVRDIVHDHGGTIDVQSRAGEGTTFVIELQAAD
jgi:signal transduction histidine kinase